MYLIRSILFSQIDFIKSQCSLERALRASLVLFIFVFFTVNSTVLRCCTHPYWRYDFLFLDSIGQTSTRNFCQSLSSWIPLQEDNTSQLVMSGFCIATSNIPQLGITHHAKFISASVPNNRFEIKSLVAFEAYVFCAFPTEVLGSLSVNQIP